MSSPTANDAGRIAQDVLGETIAAVERFTAGAANWVYDVTSSAGRRVVVRISRERDECAGGVHWSRKLRPIGVPLPEMIAYRLPTDGQGRAWTVLDRFAGTDLENVYRSLTAAQKLAILDRVMAAQAIVQRLPQGERFGFTQGTGAAECGAWRDVLVMHLRRSRGHIERVRAIDPSCADRVMRHVEREDFSDVAPIPFLDDTTERNVIVHDGVFQGIVDVDGICFGDPLFVTALTRMALLNEGGDTLYADAWTDRLNLSPTKRRHFELYTAMFAVNFLGEQGQQFNRDAPPAVDPGDVNRLVSVLDGLLERLI